MIVIVDESGMGREIGPDYTLGDYNDNISLVYQWEVYSNQPWQEEHPPLPAVDRQGNKIHIGEYEAEIIGNYYVCDLY